MNSTITRTLAAITAAAVIALAAHDLFAWVLPVQAATAPPTVPDVCEAVAKVSDIVYYYCQPDDGPYFLTNSVGFIVLEQ